jgi:hypothetical protein
MSILPGEDPPICLEMISHARNFAASIPTAFSAFPLSAAAVLTQGDYNFKKECALPT